MFACFMITTLHFDTCYKTECWTIYIIGIHVQNNNYSLCNYFNDKVCSTVEIILGHRKVRQLQREGIQLLGALWEWSNLNFHEFKFELRSNSNFSNTLNPRTPDELQRNNYEMVTIFIGHTGNSWNKKGILYPIVYRVRLFIFF